MIYANYIKRFLDFFLSIIALIILTPAFLVIAIFIKIDSKGPILFRQLRVGKNKFEFYIYKFRTMKVDTPTNVPTWLLENPNSRITRVGKFLRKTSLDELPQIVNIIKGEMSIIGPRPVILNEHELFVERDKNKVYNIRPGLTGWAQINGRDVISIIDKAALDGYYAKNMSFVFDAKIFILTIIKVLKSEGVKEGVHVVNENTSGSEGKLIR